jgi:peptide/nickel transport system substrate-binding protein
MRKSMIAIVMGIFMTYTFFMAAVLFASPAQGSPQQGGVLKIITFPPPVIGYPPEFRMGPTRISASPCLETLASIDQQGRFVPTKLCTAWELGPDGKSIKLLLRKGVKFHDGTDFNAEAVKWNLEKAMEKKLSLASTYTSIDILDDYTVRINISHFQNNIIYNLPYIISPTAVKKNGVEWARVHPVGTGPFKFVSFERDVSVKYERFDDYWGGKPHLDGIEFIYLTDPMVKSAAVQRGDAQVIHECGAKVASELISKGYKAISLDWIFLSFLADSANENSPFANKKVREALEYAIDKKAIVEATGYGLAEPMNQICPPSYMGHISNLEGRLYNTDYIILRKQNNCWQRQDILKDLKRRCIFRSGKIRMLWSQYKDTLKILVFVPK